MTSAEPILTVAQMVAAEEAAMASGTSVHELMERAGTQAADWVWRIAMGNPVTVLCGPGNNGGDGYVIARTLAARGGSVNVVATAPPRTEAARAAAKQWSGPVVPAQEIETATGGGTLVDCLFGSGLSRQLLDEHINLLSTLAASHQSLIAIDLPSGLDADSGALLGSPVQYDATLALGAWKFAHWTLPAAGRMGMRRLVDLGVSPTEQHARLIKRPQLCAPASDAHKYSRGLLTVIAGAMPGAAVLAASAAIHSGAGYVRLAAEQSHPAVPAGLVTDDGPLGDALDDARIDAQLVGPGLGRSDAALARLRTVLSCDRPTVLDGDALSMLTPAMLQGKAPVVLTPHEGELARLCEAFAIEGAHRRARAAALAETSGCVVVAKGPGTVVAGPDGQLAVQGDASPWLSVAGSGDCLAGIIASRLAAGERAFDAACSGVWLHAEAARIASPACSADALAKATATAMSAAL